MIQRSLCYVLPTNNAKDRRVKFSELTSLAARENDAWTTEHLVDKLFLHLASKKENTSTANGRSVTFRKYYRQARDLMKWIPIAKPSPQFIIHVSDLTPRLIRELEELTATPTVLNYVVTQAVGRIFESLDFEYYHLSVAGCLTWRFER